MLSSFNTSLRNCSYICLSLNSLNSPGSTQLFTSITPDPFTASSNHPHILSNTVHERCTFLNLLRSVHLFLVTNKSDLRHCSGGLHCACPSFPAPPVLVHFSFVYFKTRAPASACTVLLPFFQWSFNGLVLHLLSRFWSTFILFPLFSYLLFFAFFAASG